jgi:hypothetical protein
MLHAFSIAALIFAAITPGLNARAILEIISPVALVLGSIQVHINSIPISFVFLPETFVNVAICMPEFSFSIGFVEFPFSFVLCAIWPNLSSGSMSETIFKVTLVDCTILKNELLNKFKALTNGLAFELSELLIPRKMHYFLSRSFPHGNIFLNGRLRLTDNLNVAVVLGVFQFFLLESTRDESTYGVNPDFLGSVVLIITGASGAHLILI